MTTTTADAGITTRIASRIAQAVGPRRYAMWFDRSARFDYEDDRRMLCVAVPSRFAADWIGKHFHDKLRQAALEELGEAVEVDVRVAPDRFDAEVQSSKFKVQSSTSNIESPCNRLAGAAQPPVFSREAPRSAPLKTHASRLLRHRLEDFVVGSSNELAFAAASRLCQDDGAPNHPLFLHGSCGLGKTHLLQGICRRVLEQQPDAKVHYTTGEQFTNEYITAVRGNQLDAFRRRIRRLDVLAVDDVHFIANKQATQQEFLHSFDQIELGGARVVLASDSHPKLIRQFSEALVSRCVRGLVVQVQPPDAALRERLVHALAQRRRLVLHDSAARTLADHCHGSVREIEGLLTKLQALASLSGAAGEGKIIGHTLVNQLLEVDAGALPCRLVRFDTVLQVVAQQLGVPPAHVVGRGRQKQVVLARSLAVYLTRKMTSMSYPEIAAAMGRANHSTVITADQRMERQLAANPTVMLPPAMEPTPLKDLADRLRHAIARAS